MQKKILASIMALAMVLSLTPVTALAVDGDTAPQIVDMDIEYDGTPISKNDVNGSLVFTAEGDTNLSAYDATVEISNGAAFTASTSYSEGDLYVASATENAATLRFHVTVANGAEEEIVDEHPELDLNFTKTDSGAWEGGFSNAAILKLNMLAGYLAGKEIRLIPGALGSNSPAQRIIVNEDEINVMLILCAPNAVTYTVTYIVGNDTFVWELPQGMNMPLPVIDGENVTWYTEATPSEDAKFDGGTVAGDTTLYGVIDDGTTPTGNFYNDLTQHRTAVIEDLDDFETFVAYSDQAQAGQLIKLGADIDCAGNSYPAMEFAGDFNGCGHTISNATFEAVSDTPSGEECSGMFATLGHGQIVANLTLENVETEYAEQYSGVLVGMADGWSGDPVTIQNVQIRDGKASGRSAGGVAGFARHAVVKYCSSRSTTISGLANAGGIVGLNNTKIEYCYSTTIPTALTILGGSSGGVAGKNVRGGYTDHCWAIMKVVGKGDENPGTDVNPLVVNAFTSADAFRNAGFDQTCWVPAQGTATDFNYDVIGYTFPSET